MVLYTKTFEQWVELLLPEVRVRVSESFQLFKQACVPRTPAGALGRAVLRVEALELLAAFYRARVHFEMPNASFVASSPCFFQKVSIFALLFASSVIIYRKRMLRSRIYNQPVVFFRLLRILILLSD